MKDGMFEDARFDGADYKPERDNARLTGQLLKIWNLMIDGKFRSLPEISAEIKEPEASISAQLRHLRKERFGAHTVERVRGANSLYLYKLIVNTKE